MRRQQQLEQQQWQPRGMVQVPEQLLQQVALGAEGAGHRGCPPRKMPSARLAEPLQRCWALPQQVAAARLESKVCTICRLVRYCDAGSEMGW